MKAISLWQPWASLMEAGAKQIETRSRLTHWRGDIAICAARYWGSEGHEMLRTDAAQHALRSRYSGGQLHVNKWNLPYGKVIAVVEIFDCIKSDDANANWNLCNGLMTEPERLFGNYEPGRYLWLTRHRRKLARPVLVIGRQFIFDLPSAIEAQVMEQL